MSDSQEIGRPGIWPLSSDERLALARALLARPTRAADGRASLRRRYPSAPEAMIDSATHHVYVDGPEAVVDFLADAELAIRDPAHELDQGVAYHVLDHVYNWLQFRTLLPEAKTDMLALLDQIEEAVKDDDRDYLLASIAEFRRLLEATRNAPDFEVS